MKEKVLYGIWGAMAALCIGLGTLEADFLLLKIALGLIGVMFFVPGGILLYDALSAGNRKGVLRIRWISLLSLVLTVVSFLAFFITAARGAAAAEIFYDVLLILSCPMLCCQWWVISLFLWSCLLSASFVKTHQR